MCISIGNRGTEAGDAFDQSAAVGFIKIFGLPLATAARKAPGAKKKMLAVTR